MGHEYTSKWKKYQQQQQQHHRIVVVEWIAVNQNWLKMKKFFLIQHASFQTNRTMIKFEITSSVSQFDLIWFLFQFGQCGKFFNSSKFKVNLLKKENWKKIAKRWLKKKLHTKLDFNWINVQIRIDLNWLLFASN